MNKAEFPVVDSKHDEFAAHEDHHVVPNDSQHRGTSPRKYSRLPVVNVRPTSERLRAAMLVDVKEHQTVEGDEAVQSHGTVSSSQRLFLSGQNRQCNACCHALNQAPAVALVALFHLMVGIPFGVSYFPVGWKNSFGDDESSQIQRSGGDDDTAGGLFPLPGKESLGIRMFLFSTILGQLIFTFASKFNSAVGLQMVENVPFCHSLAYIVIKDQGYGLESLSTLFFLFALASVLVGAVFFILGKFELGRIIYFFPSHVLVGCIGGIGVFIARTGLEVTIDTPLEFNKNGVHVFMENLHLLGVVFLFEVVLRILTHVTSKDGAPKYPLLSPIYFIMITPLFYTALWVFRIDPVDANNAGYFFPQLDECDQDCSGNRDNTMFDGILDIWRIVNFSTVSWSAVFNTAPTMVALVLFSLIHVPINIPAFAITAGVDVDMNNELIAHGYSNALAGMFGGLQNYMAYTQSVIYLKSGGSGKSSSLAVVAATSLLFVVGPTIASYMPRAMAGTLLLHVGIDLFLEGVYDSYGKYDYLEYAGVWLIAIVMTLYGMEAALVAGVIAALSTYAFQSITYQDPIRGCMSAATLRSSYWNRDHEAESILNSDFSGRRRVFVVQLQGHLFFGNNAQLTDRLKKYLEERRGTSEEPWVVIMDFSLVIGIDASAAQAIVKMRDSMHQYFGVDHCIFVTGSTDGFPCEYPLSRELIRAPPKPNIDPKDANIGSGQNECTSLLTSSGSGEKEAYGLCDTKPLRLDGADIVSTLPENYVCTDLDAALVFSENAIIARADPTLLGHEFSSDSFHGNKILDDGSSLEEERDCAFQLLFRLCPDESVGDVKELISLFKREVFHENDTLWLQGSASTCTKLLVCGSLVSLLENEAGTSETIKAGNMIGESGLVQGIERMSTVKCVSEKSILYSLDLSSWRILVKERPNLAVIIYSIVVRYLTHRVQHVSNRIFETRCLPV